MIKAPNRISLEIDERELMSEKLSAIVSMIEATLKPYQHWLRTEIEKRNGIAHTIRISAEINVK